MQDESHHDSPLEDLTKLLRAFIESEAMSRSRATASSTALQLLAPPRDTARTRAYLDLTAPPGGQSDCPLERAG